MLYPSLVSSNICYGWNIFHFLKIELAAETVSILFLLTQPVSTAQDTRSHWQHLLFQAMVIGFGMYLGLLDQWESFKGHVLDILTRGTCISSGGTQQWGKTLVVLVVTQLLPQNESFQKDSHRPEKQDWKLQSSLLVLSNQDYDELAFAIS